MENSIEFKLSKVFCEIFRLTPSQLENIKLKLHRGFHPWDSIMHIELLNAVEKEFKIEFELNSALKIKDWDSARQEIENTSGDLSIE